MIFLIYTHVKDKQRVRPVRFLAGQWAMFGQRTLSVIFR
jgi:hypothetical protein